MYIYIYTCRLHLLMTMVESPTARLMFERVIRCYQGGAQLQLDHAKEIQSESVRCVSRIASP